MPHGVGGVVHALSTAPVPDDERRGGEGVDNPTRTLATRQEAATRRNIALFKNSVLGFASSRRRHPGPTGEWPPNDGTSPLSDSARASGCPPSVDAVAVDRGQPDPNIVGGVVHALSTAPVPDDERRGAGSGFRQTHAHSRALGARHPAGARRPAGVAPGGVRAGVPGDAAADVAAGVPGGAHSIQDNHAHFLVEAAGKPGEATTRREHRPIQNSVLGMPSATARSPRRARAHVAAREGLAAGRLDRSRGSAGRQSVGRRRTARRQPYSCQSRRR